MLRRSIAVVALLVLFSPPLVAQFVRPTSPESPKLWGVEGGIVVGVHPGFVDPLDRVGPRGLIRIGLFVDGKPQLINFVAVEPLVGRAKGLSELEKGRDGKPGKQFLVSNQVDQIPPADAGAVPGIVRKTPDGKVLTFAIHPERFANGAHPVIEVSLFEKHPQRVRFRTFVRDDSAAIDQLTLSATMGNLARTRHLWLANESVHSVELYRGYRGNHFVEHGTYPLGELHRTKTGDVVVAVTPNEFDPREAIPFADGTWRCPVDWLTQYWLKPAGTFDDSLVCRVNGRHVYWRSKTALPGGTAYENFELRERFQPGQEVWFGFEARSPHEVFGFPYELPPTRAMSREVSTAEHTRWVEAKKSKRALTNGDFASGLDGWTYEPLEDASESPPFRVFETGGERRLTTFVGGDGDQGRLSQCFRVPKDAKHLRFFLHGGCDPKRLQVNLWSGERLVRSMTGRDTNDPVELRWSLESVRDEVVTLEIVDRSTGAWGFIGVHGFEVVTE